MTASSVDLESLTRDHEQLVAFQRDTRVALVQVEQDMRRFLSRRLSNAVLRGVVALLEIETKESRRLFLALRAIRGGRESEPLPQVCNPPAMDEEPRRVIERILGEWRAMVADLDALVKVSHEQLRAASEQVAQ